MIETRSRDEEFQSFSWGLLVPMALIGSFAFFGETVVVHLVWRFLG